MMKSPHAQHRKAVKKALYKRFGYVVGSKYFSLYAKDFGMQVSPVWVTLRRFRKDYDRYQFERKYKAWWKRIYGKWPPVKITEYPGRTIARLMTLAEQKEVEAIQLDINSPGGMIGTDFPPADSIVRVMGIPKGLENIKRSGGITPTSDELVIGQKQLRQTVEDILQNYKTQSND
jgi:hypothetical protein